MIPRIQTGSSFKGAALYYLHDKRLEGESERLTTDRVAWTYAHNTLEDDPQAVIREMQYTAMHQEMLKYLSGNRTDGRPTKNTVMTVALAWSPDQSPTKEQMIEAGRSYLQHMGWEGHQVLFVGHNDTKHPHFHMIINRVHPETGMTLDDNWSKTRAQRWALSYEREHGRIYCHAREAKYERALARDAPHMNHREWETWQEILKQRGTEPEFREAVQDGEWKALKHGQRQEREGFWKETGRMRQDLRATLRETVREEFAGEWRAYTVHKAERMEQAQAYDRETRNAIRQARKDARLKGQVRIIDPVTQRRVRLDGTDAVAKIKERQDAYHERLRQELKEMRADISSRQKQRLEELAAPALDKLSKDRLAAFDEVKARHRDEKAGLRDDQAAGVRRPDVLGGYSKESQGTPLTPEQSAAYTHHAINEAARRAEFDGARGEVTGADRGRAQEPDRDPHEAQRAKETTDRHLEKRDKDQAQQHEGDRRARVEWLIEKRKRDRDRERGDGGRER
jgi:Relaxase/Mobilisation nuclease domain